MAKTPASFEQQKPVIFFDGVCNLCNKSVQFVIARDKKDIFRFAPLQSSVAEKLFANQPYLLQAPASVLLVQDGKMYVESTAALKIARQLGGIWSALYWLILIPPFLRDLLYRFIATRRYKWFGKRDTCMVPEQEWKYKFIA